MAIEVVIVGGGMIVHDQILPSLYHLQRQGRVAEIAVCASRHETVRALAEASALLRAFPGQRFQMYPGSPAAGRQPELFREVMGRLAPRNLVVVAVPDQLHYDVVMEALRRDQHVLCVKPLVLQYRQAAEIAAISRQRGLLVAIEYHKRFDDRSLM